MFRAISRETLAAKIHLFKIKTQAIVRKALAGGLLSPGLMKDASVFF
jgi:hypothetical protein